MESTWNIIHLYTMVYFHFLSGNVEHIFLALYWHCEIVNFSTLLLILLLMLLLYAEARVY